MAKLVFFFKDGEKNAVKLTRIPFRHGRYATPYCFEKMFTTYFRSMIAFGKARILEGEDEKLSALRLLADKYSQGEEGMEAEIAKSFSHLLMVEIAVEHPTGKETIELVRGRAECQLPEGYSP